MARKNVAAAPAVLTAPGTDHHRRRHRPRRGRGRALVGARALVAFTMTGATARRLARYRSPIPLLAFTSSPATRSQLSLTWGVETFIVPEVNHTDEMVRQVEAALLDIARLDKGDTVVIVAGSPPGSPGKTNALRVHRIGDAVAGP
jgi:pyruvate kinase